MATENCASKGPSLPHHDILQRVKEIIAEQIGGDASKIAEHHLLDEDLACDSLDKVEIVMNLEEEFSISVPDDIADEVRSVGDVTDKVTALLNRSTDVA